MSSLQRVERVDFQIAPGIFIDFYRFSDGEKRIGVTGAAIACGYKKNYLTELEDKSPDRLKILRSKGFDGSRRHGMIERASIGGRGSAKAATLSQYDFIAFIKYASSVGKKPQAQALLEALAGVAIEAIALSSAVFNRFEYYCRHFWPQP